MWKTLIEKLPRRKYLRPLPPSRRERAIGFVILTIVAGIGMGVFLAGRSYDPNLFRLDPNLLKKSDNKASIAATVEGERRSPQGLEGSGASQPASTETAPVYGSKTDDSKAGLIPADAGGTSWKRDANVQSFGFDNLYDKIDGRENLYKSYEFKELLATDYTGAEKGRFIQVELFDMTSARSALGVFTAERPQHPNAIKIGRDGYAETNGVFFWKGKYYVRVIGSDNDKSTLQAATAIARAIEGRLPDSKDDLASADPLPTANRVPNSFQLIQESAFSLSFLRNVSAARYKIDNMELNGFIMTTDSDAKANAIIEQFGKEMESYGKLNQVGNEGIYHVEALGTHYVIFARGKIVGGVMEADGRDPAIKLARQIADHVKAK